MCGFHSRILTAQCLKENTLLLLKKSLPVRLWGASLGFIGLLWSYRPQEAFSCKSFWSLVLWINEAPFFPRHIENYYELTGVDVYSLAREKQGGREGGPGGSRQAARRGDPELTTSVSFTRTWFPGAPLGTSRVLSLPFWKRRILGAAY